MQQTEFSVIFDHFLHFYPPLTTWKITFWKMKKTPGDNITLHKCTKNHDHMLYCSWDMTSDGCNFHFSFWAIFCPFFIPLTAPKIKIYEKIKKNNWRYHNFTWAPKTCTVPELWCTMDGWTVRRTDQWKKWHTVWWVPYLKIIFKVGYAKVKLSLLSPN